MEVHGATAFLTDEIDPGHAGWEGTGARGIIERALADSRLVGTTVGLSVFVEGLGEVAVHQPDLPLNPASNQKLLHGHGRPASPRRRGAAADVLIMSAAVASLVAVGFGLLKAAEAHE